jgi:hypothetical protein
VDGDGDLDIVFANGHVASYSCSGQPPFPGCAQVTQGRPDRLYLNDGVGSFTVAPVTQMPGSWDCAASVALGDVDGDGDLDIVFGNDRASYESGYGPLLGGLISSASGHENHLFLNDGNGVFSYAAQLPVDASVTGAVAFADVDGDGDLDLVCANDDPGHSRLYVNDGTGTFGDGTAARMPTGGASRSLAAGDVDHDGDPDLVTAGRLYTNLLRQLHAPSAPQVGQPYLLDAYSRYGPPAVFDVAVVVLSTNRVSVPVSPFGLLGVEPMLQLPAVVIPQPAGVGTVAWTPPNVPGMVGMPLYSQALVVPWPFDARLTNVVGGVVQ